jgi:hypothetical protein
MSQLLNDLRALEIFAQARQSTEEVRMVFVTREEADVIDSFRRFKAQDYDEFIGNTASPA